MPSYKRQHYLPAAYLRYFSIDQTQCTRNAKTWRYDGDALRCVPVTSQCFDDYFYSREKAEEVEARFQKLESAYCLCVDKIRSGRRLLPREYGNLMVLLFDFFVRNAIHQNETGKEGFEAYNLMHQIMANQVLAVESDGFVSNRDLIQHFEKNWRIQLFSAPSSKSFISSDNPSVFLSFRKSIPGIHLAVLPLTPTRLIAIFDRRVLRIISKEMTADDVFTMNCGQIANAKNCVFSAVKFTDQDTAYIKEHLRGESAAQSVLTENKWIFSIKQVAEDCPLSFVKVNPPLF